MSIFGSIMSKIFGQGDQAAQAASASPQAAGATTAAATGSPASAPAGTAPGTPPVDVEAVLSRMATEHGGGGNWQTSIVDLLKLLSLDSSLAARKDLATELNVHAGGDGTAEQNMALHRAVMQKLAENGGKVPDSLRA